MTVWLIYSLKNGQQRSTMKIFLIKILLKVKRHSLNTNVHNGIITKHLFLNRIYVFNFSTIDGMYPNIYSMDKTIKSIQVSQ
jgi:hypothetical protein